MSLNKSLYEQNPVNIAAHSKNGSESNRYHSSLGRDLEIRSPVIVLLI